MSGGRYAKGLPEFIYFVGENEWIQGPYVNPKRGSGHKQRKFKLVEVPMNEPKRKKTTLTEGKIKGNIKPPPDIDKADVLPPPAPQPLNK